jgi:hypothetical protein
VKFANAINRPAEIASAAFFSTAAARQRRIVGKWRTSGEKIKAA